MDTFWIIFLFAIGACVGSFLNVVIYRLPRGESIVFPGSHCPNCGRAIRWYDNIPILSWLALRGRCRFCSKPISPRYIAVEAIAGVLVAGLYVCYYVLRLRSGAGDFLDTWPTFTAHAVLLCGLLACSLVDIDQWIVPLEVCWFVSLAGLVSAAASPHFAWIPAVSPAVGAMVVGAAVGLAISLVLLHYGLIQRSFLDAQEPAQAPKPSREEESTKTLPRSPKKNRNKGKKNAKGKKAPKPKPKPAPPTVAISKAHGVNPRREVLREAKFLTPAIVLGIAGYVLVARFAPVASAWGYLCDVSKAGSFAYASHVNALLGAGLGYLVGGAWVWGMRILGTIGFGKEAMGMGDVHILAAVGAVTGWVVPSLAFFVAPLFGLIWAIYLLIARRQRELPYGPWLAVATLAVMLFYNGFDEFLNNLLP